MSKIKYCLFNWLLLMLILSSCKKKIPKSEAYRIGIEKCTQQPNFLTKIGMDPYRCLYTTYLGNVTGIAIVELPPLNASTKNQRIYQHDSWKKFGMMGPLTTGRSGVEFTAPAPFVNTLNKSNAELNKIYQIEPENGIMGEFLTLPIGNNTEETVPFGILGLYFDCHGNKLYSSTVAGSTRDNENGVIYSIEPNTKKINDKLEGFDALGLYVCGITGTKLLYFGSARNSNIYGIELDQEGNFVGKPSIQFSLAGLGMRGDDKARRLRIGRNNYMEVTSAEFNYNLTANSEVLASKYYFEYFEVENKWVFKQVND
jgi:hypothetical protein